MTQFQGWVFVSGIDSFSGVGSLQGWARVRGRLIFKGAFTSGMDSFQEYTQLRGEFLRGGLNSEIDSFLG